jgi:hypothetical protein
VPDVPHDAMHNAAAIVATVVIIIFVIFCSSLKSQFLLAVS